MPEPPSLPPRPFDIDAQIDMVLPGDLSDARPKRLRFLMFNKVGKVVQHARRTLLRLTSAAQQTLVTLARTNILALSQK